MRGLVLGAGGLAGIAWETGVLAGLAEEGVDVAATADRLLATSAGSTVAAQIGSGLPIAELFRRQAEPALQNHEAAPSPTAMIELMQTLARLQAEYPDPFDLRRKIGELALTAPTAATAAERLAVIAGRLPSHEWPERPLGVVAVDVHSGEHRVIDRSSGVGLVEAVAASCAVPGIWPLVELDGHTYMDGALRTSNNADLLTGQDAVLVVAPGADPALAEQIALLERTGRALAITPDEDALAAFGPNGLDPAVRTPAAHAGRAQGRKLAATVRDLWTA
ncbi:patatin-like phospholipase family protein [Kitasatospora paracochleata]|uniref:NTE family protein n=1 Tax=Kitasatospora paracochleata TaxID=58354 RepID=A0ABT1IZM7_9ACTN|nr:patatin-like phospholipase family protein [Kitasatospora paracochleata]MCP2310321.1 NTE family protein [Kitasatospora paracochleata]